MWNAVNPLLFQIFHWTRLFSLKTFVNKKSNCPIFHGKPVRYQKSQKWIALFLSTRSFCDRNATYPVSHIQEEGWPPCNALCKCNNSGVSQMQLWSGIKLYSAVLPQRRRSYFHNALFVENQEEGHINLGISQTSPLPLLAIIS